MNVQKLLLSLKRMGKDEKTNIQTYQRCLRSLISACNVNGSRREHTLLEGFKYLLQSSKPISSVVISEPIVIEPIKIKPVKKPANPKISEIRTILSNNRDPNKYTMYFEYNGKTHQIGKRKGNKKYMFNRHIDNFVGRKYIHLVKIRYPHSKTKRIKVPILDFKIVVNEEWKIMNEMMELVKDYHKDVFKTLIKRYSKHKENFESVRIEKGRSAVSQRGTYCRSYNKITINKRYHNEKMAGYRIKRSVLESVLKTIFHELIHVFIYTHQAHFHVYNYKFKHSIYATERFNKLILKTGILINTL